MTKIPNSKFDELVKSRKTALSVIPAPHGIRDKLQPESSLFEYLQRLWTPVFTGVTTFYETVKLDSPIKSQISPPPRKDIGIFDWRGGIKGRGIYQGRRDFWTFYDSIKLVTKFEGRESKKQENAYL